MPEAVRSLGGVFAEEARGRVAVVARGDGAMARFQPAVILLAHDVAIGARCGIIGQVRPALRVDEGVRAQSDRRADRYAENQTLKRTLFHAAAPCEIRSVLRVGFEPDVNTTTKQMIAKGPSNTKPGVNVPVACLAIHNLNGGHCNHLLFPSTERFSERDPSALILGGRRLGA